MAKFLVFLVLVSCIALSFAETIDEDGPDKSEILDTAEGNFNGGLGIGYYGANLYRPLAFGKANIHGYFRPHFGGFHGRTFGYHGYRPHLTPAFGHQAYGSFRFHG